MAKKSQFDSTLCFLAGRGREYAANEALCGPDLPLACAMYGSCMPSIYIPSCPSQPRTQMWNMEQPRVKQRQANGAHERLFTMRKHQFQQKGPCISGLSLGEGLKFAR